MAETPSKSDRPGTAARRFLSSYSEAVSIYDGPRIFQHAFLRLAEPVRHLLAVWYCNHEIMNGGFNQFFSNSTGVLAPEALTGYRAIGLPECAQVVATAIARFGQRYPRSRKAREAAMQPLYRIAAERGQRDPFMELDDLYVAAWEREGFYQREMHSPGGMLNNPTLHRTGPAECVLVCLKSRRFRPGR